ncbi:flagellar biosynthesis protein FlaG [Bacillus sp. V3-13]|uniref:flagellar protein FlaG n=1 Tax=Bacillus sp. V3-13 TaxID=2053728 RepID=UPI000C77B70D|nr:flagellar protein FlaG [Bacillus sp. V3-13]PLR78236.1 flagellar biosynthesis protein FlaG [Bacillus sp. V3-13]
MGSVDSISKLSIVEKPVEHKNPVTSHSREKKSNSLEQQSEKMIEHTIKKEELEKVVKDLNSFLNNAQTSLKYVYHEKLEKYYVTLINDETKETVKEIPPKKLLDMYASMKEYLGLFVDSKI